MENNIFCPNLSGMWITQGGGHYLANKENVETFFLHTLLKLKFDFYKNYNIDKNYHCTIYNNIYCNNLNKNNTNIKTYKTILYNKIRYKYTNNYRFIIYRINNLIKKLRHIIDVSFCVCKKLI